MAFKSKMISREALTRRLNALVPEAEAAIAAAQLEGAQDLAEAIRARAPRDDGDYAASIIGDKLANHKDRSLLGVGQTKDPNATGVFANFKWRWIEFGTTERIVTSTGKSAGRMPRFPHIFPTYRSKRKSIRRKIATALNRAVRKVAKG